MNSDISKKIENYHKTIKNLKNQLKKTNEFAELETFRAQKLLQEIDELTMKNRSLEEKITSLNETHFLEQTASVRRSGKLSSYEHLINVKELEIRKLQEKSSEQINRLSEYQNTISQLQKEKHDAKQTLERLKGIISSMRSGKCSNNIDTQGKTSDFTLTQEVIGNESKKYIVNLIGSTKERVLLSPEDIIERFETAQKTLIGRTQDLNRTEIMLKTQVKLNEDLQVDLSKIKSQLEETAIKFELNEKKLESISTNRFQQIQSIQSSLIQYFGNNSDCIQGNISKSSSSTYCKAISNLLKDKQFLQISVTKVEIENELCGDDLKLLLVVQFLEYNTFASSAIIERSSSDNFVACYNIQTNTFLSNSYLTPLPIIVELFQINDDTKKLVAKGLTTMETFLQNSQTNYDFKLSLASVDQEKSMFANVFVEINLYDQLTCRTRALSDRESNWYASNHQDAMSDYKQSLDRSNNKRALYEMEVIIHKVTNLILNQTRKEDSCVYVQYKFLDNYRTRTDTKTPFPEIIWEHSSTFPIRRSSHEGLCTILVESIQFAVLKRTAESMQIGSGIGTFDPDSKLVGIAELHLDAVATGNDIKKAIQVISKDGTSVGSIHITLRLRQNIKDDSTQIQESSL